MFTTNLLSRKDGDERGGRRRFFYIWPATGFLTFDEAHRTHDFKSKFPRGFNRLNGRRPGCTNIVDDYHPRALFPEALDPLTHAVLLFGFANQESTHFSAGNGNGDHDRIGSHRKAADSLRFPSALVNLFEKNLAGELRASRVQGAKAAVDVIVARGSRR